MGVEERVWLWKKFRSRTILSESIQGLKDAGIIKIMGL